MAIANDITLNVDYLNDGNTTAEAYENEDRTGNRSTYAGENHALDARDQINFYRSYNTKNGNFKGVSKSSFKLTKDFTVTGVDGLAALTAPVICEVSFSIPVGVSAADVKKVRQRALALLDDDTIMDALNVKLMI